MIEEKRKESLGGIQGKRENHQKTSQGELKKEKKEGTFCGRGVQFPFLQKKIETCGHKPKFNKFWFLFKLSVLLETLILIIITFLELLEQVKENYERKL